MIMDALDAVIPCKFDFNNLCLFVKIHGNQFAFLHGKENKRRNFPKDPIQGIIDFARARTAYSRMGLLMVV